MNILLVEDDSTFRTRLAQSLREREHVVLEAGTFEETEVILREHQPSHALVDLRLGKDSGLDIISLLTKYAATCHTVVLTGFGSVPTTLEAIRRGAANFLQKPASLDAVLKALSEDIREAHSDSENRAQAAPLPVPSLDEIERDHLERVLKDCDGNVSRSAKMLGIHRRVLQRKLRKLFP